VDGFISMNVYSQQYNQGAYPPYPGYPTGTAPSPYPSTGMGQAQTASVTGFLQLNPATVQDIAFKFSGGMGGYTQPGYFPQPGYPQQQQLCVSGIAMNLGHYYNYIYGGAVYLYLNGTNHGYVVPF
jgi:hypothetical protein